MLRICLLFLLLSLAACDRKLDAEPDTLTKILPIGNWFRIAEDGLHTWASHWQFDPDGTFTVNAYQCLSYEQVTHHTKRGQWKLIGNHFTLSYNNESENADTTYQLSNLSENTIVFTDKFGDAANFYQIAADLSVDCTTTREDLVLE